MPHSFISPGCRARFLLLWLLAVAFVLFLPTFACAAATDVFAITGARIVPVAGQPIAKGTIVLRDGIIEAVGERVTVPADASVIDGAGLTVYPGLIDGMTRLGMPAAADYPTTRGDAYSVAAVRPETLATGLLRPDAATFTAHRQAGFTAALSAPSVGLLSGQSALISLGTAEEDPAALIVRAPVAAHLNFGSPNDVRGYPVSLMGQIAAARQALYDAQDAALRVADYDRNPSGKPRPAAGRALIALRPVVEKRLPLIVRADSAQAILRALKFAKEFGLRPVIEGGAESYRVAGELKAARAAVLLSAALPEPPRVTPGDDDPSTLQGLRRRALVPTSAVVLHRAGVAFGFTTNGLERPADFSGNVRKMIAAGLPESVAVEAATLGVARILGSERQLGSLEKGKIANVLVTRGGLFGENARIEHLFVDGEKVDISAAAPRRTEATTAAAAAITPAERRAARRAGRTAPPPPRTDLPEARVRDNPDAETDTTDQARRLPTRTPTDPDPAKPPTPAAPPLAATDARVPALPKPLPASFVLRGATVWTLGQQGTLKNADVYVSNGKIVAVGPGLKVPAGTTEIAARGKHVTPGMIDAHSHTAIEGGVNEGTNIVTAEVRVADVIDADDVNIYRQLAGGTTTANLLHGSANSIGGQNAVVKWRWGSGPDALVMKEAPPGIKFALGENPKRAASQGVSATPPRYPTTRMGVEKTIRDTFVRARDYQAKWKAYQAGKTTLAPRRDLQLDAIVEILEGKRLVHCHSYRQDEILMMVRLADEFGFRIATFQHVLEGYKVADEMARHGAGGSTFSDWWAYKVEAWDAIPYNGALMAARGVLTSFNSDSSELARRMNLEAAKAIHWGGMTPEAALALVTINPARQLGIDRNVGSLAPGKDADLVVWSGDPLSTLTICEKTFVDGRLLFDREQDLAQRSRLEAEKKRLATAERPASTSRGRTDTDTKPADKPGKPARTVKRLADASKPAVTRIVVADAPATAIIGATIHPVSGPDIANGVLLVRDGKISAMGTADAVTIPQDARRITATGLHLYPGLIDADTTLGLTEIGSIRATRDDREIGEFSPELRAVVAVNPDSELIPVARANGILHAVTAPSGGIVSGLGALLQLDGWTWEDMGVVPSLGMYVNFPTLGQRRFRETAHRCEEGAGHVHAEEEDDPAFRSGAWIPAGSHDTNALRYGDHPDTAQGQDAPAAPAPSATTAAPDPSNADAVLRPLNRFLEGARRYHTARSAEGSGVPAHERDPRFEAMIPVLEGVTPVFIRADRERDIRAAVAWAGKEGLRVVLVGGQEADKAADVLVQEKIPVILGPVLNLPPRFDSPYDHAYTLPARLAKAGVHFCLSTGDASNVRRLPYHAAMAAAFGLPTDEALKAITLYPAQVLGVGDRTGSLEVGKEANLILTTGNPLEIVTEVRAAFIAGRPVDLNNKHLRLYEKYRARPQTR